MRRSSARSRGPHVLVDVAVTVRSLVRITAVPAPRPRSADDLDVRARPGGRRRRGVVGDVARPPGHDDRRRRRRRPGRGRRPRRTSRARRRSGPSTGPRRRASIFTSRLLGHLAGGPAGVGVARPRRRPGRSPTFVAPSASPPSGRPGRRTPGRGRSANAEPVGAPAEPAASSTITVSLVEVQPSTIEALNERAPRRAGRRSSAALSSASVVSTAEHRRHVGGDHARALRHAADRAAAARRTTCLGWVSVVMMAGRRRQAGVGRLSGRPRAPGRRPTARRAAGSRSARCEQTSTSLGRSPSALGDEPAGPRGVASAGGAGRGVRVQPLLRTTAAARPPVPPGAARLTTGAAAAWLVVNTAAAGTGGRGGGTRARSGAPLSLMPAGDPGRRRSRRGGVARSPPLVRHADGGEDARRVR